MSPAATNSHHHHLATTPAGVAVAIGVAAARGWVACAIAPARSGDGVTLISDGAHYRHLLEEEGIGAATRRPRLLVHVTFHRPGFEGEPNCLQG